MLLKTFVILVSFALTDSFAALYEPVEAFGDYDTGISGNNLYSYSHCRLGVERAECLSINKSYYGEVTKIPLLRNDFKNNPSYISVGAINCFIDHEGLECKGWRRQRSSHYIQYPKISASKIHSLSVDKEFICAFTNDNLKCWGDVAQKIQRMWKKRPALSGAKFFEIGHEDFICASDEEGLKCWDEEKSFFYPSAHIENMNVLNSKYTSEKSVCIKMAKEMKCFLYHEEKLLSSFDVDQLEKWLFVKGLNIVPSEISDKLKGPLQGIRFSRFLKCGFNKEEIWCWGHFIDPQRIDFKNTKTIDVYKEDVCMSNNEEVRCISMGRFFNSTFHIPSIFHPRMIRGSRDDRNCVIDEKGIKCWGDFSENYRAARLSQERYLSALEKLENPKMIQINGKICALDETGPVCNNKQFSFPRKVDRPIAFDFDAKTLCVLDVKGLLCSGDGAKELMKGAPVIRSARWMGVWNSNICLLDKNTIKCWGKNFKNREEFNVDSFNLLKLSYSHDEILRRAKNFYAIPTTRFNSSDFYLSQIDLYLNYVEDNSPPLSSYFLKKISESLRKNNLLSIHGGSLSESLSRYLSLKLAAPAVLNNTSKLFQGEIIPALEKGLDVFEKDLKIVSLSDIPDSKRNRKITLDSLLGVLKGMSKILLLKERKKILPLMQLIAKSYVKPMDEELMRSLLGELDKVKRELEGTRLSSKTSFLFDVYTMGLKWLNKCVVNKI